MILSEEARRVLDLSIRQNGLSETGKREVEDLLATMPEDRVLLYKNVDSNPVGDLSRYSIHIRIQHLLIFTTFLLLAFTGMPIHYFDTFWARPLNAFFGGVGVTRVVHRTLAVVMIAAMLYHFAAILLGTLSRIRGNRFDVRRTIVPAMKDLRDFREDALYFAGRRDQRPEMDKFVYKQKMHYFAAGGGNLILVLSGSSFLFPEMWASVLPMAAASYFQEIMRMSHAHEALLALLVIAFWHWYNVHLAPGRFPMQWSYLTGKITREHQIEEHFLEYVRCLVEVPEERRALRAMLEARGLAAHGESPRGSAAEEAGR
ncbi:MAG: hypothetical protein A2V83_01080 [Nitrospirae bacterium RBG_16_64_22]|nr:MAG: hypothetical protein A2V83_01080 [Nitrospirae bacterium RBG_16_64_22]